MYLVSYEVLSQLQGEPDIDIAEQEFESVRELAKFIAYLKDRDVKFHIEVI
jgi:hypothetical protein